MSEALEYHGERKDKKRIFTDLERKLLTALSFGSRTEIKKCIQALEFVDIEALLYPESFPEGLFLLGTILKLSESIAVPGLIGNAVALLSKLPNLATTLEQHQVAFQNRERLGLFEGNGEEEKIADQKACNILKTNGVSGVLSVLRRYARPNAKTRYVEQVLASDKEDDAANLTPMEETVSLLAVNEKEQIQVAERYLRARSVKIDQLYLVQYVQAWRLTGYAREEKEYVPEIENFFRNNLDALVALEQKHPGCAKVLTNQFGLKDFARYPLEALVAQYEQRDKNDLPFGISVNVFEDWNGAFALSKKTYASVYDQVKGKSYLRFIEVENATGFPLLLMALNEKYGYKPNDPPIAKVTRHNISFMFVGAHGHKKGFNIMAPRTEFRNQRTTDPLADVTVDNLIPFEELNKKSENPLPLFFEDDPMVVLFSCSTGMENGFAASLARAIKGRVVGPDCPTAESKVTVEFSPGMRVPTISVEYSKGNPSMYLPDNEGRPVKFVS